MRTYLCILFLISCISCQKEHSAIRDNISLQLSIYTDQNKTKASAMPVLKPGSELMPYKLRFDYLLLNIPELHQLANIKLIDSINSLYPDTTEIKRTYLEIYCQDKLLPKYFEETYTAVKSPDMQRDQAYSAEELMEVASKFFYCDEVRPDSTVQMHVCIGINGLKEAKWQKDYTLLAAFCYEAIFNDLDKDDSQIRSAYSSEHDLAVKQFRNNITSLDKYLEETRTNLFGRMKSNATLNKKLMDYYELNKNNLAFKIVK